MVEISLSGSGEGPQEATTGAYSTEARPPKGHRGLEARAVSSGVPRANEPEADLRAEISGGRELRERGRTDDVAAIRACDPG